MDHQKPTILLIFGTLSLGGCGGHPMRPKLNLKVKSQMSKPNEYTDNIKSNLTCIFLSVRTKLKKPILPSDTVYKSKFLRLEFYQKAVRSGILKYSTRNFAHKNSQLHLMISQIFIMCGLANILISGIIRYWGWHHSGTVVDKIAIFCF